MFHRLFIVFVVVCTVILGAVAEAKNGKNNSDHNGKSSHASNCGGSERSKEVRTTNYFVRGKFKVKSPLLKVRFERKVRAKRRKVEEDRVRAWVKVGVPYAAVNINNLNNAAAAVVVMSFLRHGNVYANCTLAFDEADEDDGSISAEYRLDLRKRRKKHSLKVKKGSCDTDLTVPGIENLIPDVKVGDTLMVSINGVNTLVSGAVQ